MTAFGDKAFKGMIKLKGSQWGGPLIQYNCRHENRKCGHTRDTKAAGAEKRPYEDTGRRPCASQGDLLNLPTLWGLLASRTV